jgi:putative ABC transport system permease protein
MDLIELILDSFATLTLNKLRTGLAILGIVIGIGSVIALISLGQATSKSVQNQIQSLGSNLLTVSPGSQSSGAVRTGGGSVQTLTDEDAKAIETSSQVTTIQAVSPELSRRAQITTGKSNTNTQIVGVTPSYSIVHKVSIDTGNFITDRDVNGLTKVAVVGPQVVSDLFGEGVGAVGQIIRVNGQTLTIIGVTTAKGGTGFQNQDDTVLVPLTTAQKQLFGANYLSSIALEAKSPNVMTAAQNEVGYLLLSRHKFNDPTQADFSIFSQQDILNSVNQITGTFTVLLAGVAAISLLVGGIGIMNIMLVTVTERTREIGLRKALGAKKKIIITQFLIESIILTFTGGVIGAVLGIAVTFLYSNFTGSLFVVSPISVIVAFFVSAAIGILFGWYPAKRAADLQPIEALRYE